MPSLRQATTIFRCSACKENRTQFAYHCDKCHFYLDVECALIFTGIFEGQNYILNYYHRHPLILCNKEKERNDHVVAMDAIKSSIVKYKIAPIVTSISTDHVLQPHDRSNIFCTQSTLSLFFMMIIGGASSLF